MIGVCRHCYENIMRVKDTGGAFVLCDRDFRRTSIAEFPPKDLFVDSENEQNDEEPSDEPIERHEEDDQPHVPFVLPDFGGGGGFGGFGGGSSGGGGASGDW